MSTKGHLQAVRVASLVHNAWPVRHCLINITGKIDPTAESRPATCKDRMSLVYTTYNYKEQSLCKTYDTAAVCTVDKTRAGAKVLGHSRAWRVIRLVPLPRMSTPGRNSTRFARGMQLPSSMVSRQAAQGGV